VPRKPCRFVGQGSRQSGFGRIAGRPVTISSRVHAELRRRIVSLELPPGAPLAEKELIEGFGVSRTPVREALLKLVEEQLVVIYPQSGTFVARICASIAEDAMVIRVALEGFSAREAAVRALPADDVALERAIARQRAAAGSSDIQGFHETDEAMHQLIAEIAERPNIWRVVKREKASVDRVRLLSLQFEGRFKAVIAEHKRIVDAIRARDPAKAEEMMSTHLSRVLPSVAAIRARHPNFFADESAPPGQPRRSDR
jgi:DNA-binding GntR family transcriptional regulator